MLCKRNMRLDEVKGDYSSAGTQFTCFTGFTGTKCERNMRLDEVKGDYSSAGAQFTCFTGTTYKY